MPRFEFRLQSLLRVREIERDTCRQRLGEALQAHDKLAQINAQLQQERHNLATTKTELAAGGEVQVERLMDISRYDLLLRSQVAENQSKMQQVVEELNRRRQALMAADQAVRGLEKLRERRRQSFDQEQQRLDQIVLDEVAQHVARRKKQRQS